MKIAIFSDVHSNIGALQAVINDIYRRGYDQIFCLGDIVGYGSHPKDCLDIVKEKCDEIILGNHEDMVCNFKSWESRLGNEPALAGLRHTLGQLSDEDLSFLKNLSRKRVLSDLNLTLVHAGFSDPIWQYIENDYVAEGEMRYLKTRLGFVGHTHVPVIYNGSNPVWLSRSIDGYFDLMEKCIINVGSVGQPRDRNPRASYGLLELSKGKVKYSNIRVEYNIVQAAKYIREADLPERTAARLFEGR